MPPTVLLLQEVIVSERRFQYEEEVRANPLNYDGWFDYIRLEESAGDIERTREVGAAARLRATDCRLLTATTAVVPGDRCECE